MQRDLCVCGGGLIFLQQWLIWIFFSSAIWVWTCELQHESEHLWAAVWWLWIQPLCFNGHNNVGLDLLFWFVMFVGFVALSGWSARQWWACGDWLGSQWGDCGLWYVVVRFIVVGLTMNRSVCGFKVGVAKFDMTRHEISSLQIET